jgi:hypothetical protein
MASFGGIGGIGGNTSLFETAYIGGCEKRKRRRTKKRRQNKRIRRRNRTWKL